ncbi:MAG: CRISPR-associated endonuclease Cas2 [Candidatus Calescibacterium sp.]|nr:CRISPR-associated endonuclease Cas2 [Candidatus Calescibacterium sp.]
MKVILIYDISVLDNKDYSRLSKVLKVVRKYLHHVQKSVFEGVLTEGRLKMLESEILSVVDKDKDSVIIYTFPESSSFVRKILTNSYDNTSNIV